MIRDQKRESHRDQKHLTLENLFDQYFRDYVEHRCRSKQKIQKNFDRYFDSLRNLNVNQIKPVDLQRWHNTIGTEHGHPTANRCLQLFSAVFNYGDKFELIEFRRNPAKSIQRFREEHRTRVLTEEEIPRLLAAIEQIGSGNRDLFAVNFFTGQRIANCCAMTWSELDLERGTWTIPSKKFKSARKTEIPLVEQAIEILTKRKLIYGDSEWVFPSKTSRCGHIIWPYATWKRVLNLAKIENLTPHDLRRTTATKQAELGANISVISANLGHKTLQSTGIYTQPQIPARKKFMQDAINVMLGKMTEENPDAQKLAIKKILQHLLTEPSSNPVTNDKSANAITVEVIPSKVTQSEIPGAPERRVFFKTYAAIYMDRCTRIDRPAVAKRKERLIQAYIIPQLGERLLTEITKDEIAQLKERISLNSPSSAIAAASLLQHMFKTAVLSGYAPFNPMQIEDERIAQIFKILEQVKVIRDPSMCAAVQLGFHLGVGMRGEEITGLEWSDVDLEKKRVRLESSVGRQTFKSIPSEMCAMLQRLPSFGKCDFVFPSREGRGTVTRIDRAWKRVCVTAGISDRLLLNMKSASQIYSKAATIS